MTHTQLHKIVHIENRYNKLAVIALFNALNPYGYLTDNVTAESKPTFGDGYHTKVYNGADTRYVEVDTDVRELPDKNKYVHIGIKLQLDKRLTFVEVINIEKHIVINIKDYEEKVEQAMFEMVRELIF